MGLFDSQEDVDRKERVNNMKNKIATEGLSNIIPEKDYQKIIIEQNQTLIDLMITNTIVSSGMAGDVVTIIHQDNYYKSIERVLGKEWSISLSIGYRDTSINFLNEQKDMVVNLIKIIEDEII